MVRYIAEAFQKCVNGRNCRKKGSSSPKSSPKASKASPRTPPRRRYVSPVSNVSKDKDKKSSPVYEDSEQIREYLYRSEPVAEIAVNGLSYDRVRYMYEKKRLYTQKQIDENPELRKILVFAISKSMGYDPNFPHISYVIRYLDTIDFRNKKALEDKRKVYEEAYERIQSNKRFGFIPKKVKSVRKVVKKSVRKMKKSLKRKVKK
jgi:hypothetical protein